MTIATFGTCIQNDKQSLHRMLMMPFGSIIFCKRITVFCENKDIYPLVHQNRGYIGENGLLDTRGGGT